jgi:hypothetical protein
MKEHEPTMSATLEQSRTQQLRAAAEHAPEESREDVDRPSATSPAVVPSAPPTST